MHDVIAAKKDELEELCRRYDVVRLEVFGSAARGVDFDPTSDVDFLVEFDPDSTLSPFHRRFDLVEALQKTLGLPVDLLETRAIENPFLRRSIDKSREVVCGQ